MNTVCSRYTPARFIAALIAIISMVACSGSLSHYESLTNQGILPLSSQSAYLGANLFLSDEFSKSSDLFYFLKGRGAPNAIAISSGGFGDVSMKLYYPSVKDFYIAERVVSENHYQWVTRGPYRIDRKDFRDLAGLFSGGIEEPVFEFRGKPFRFHSIAEEAMAPKISAPTPMPAHLAAKPKSKTKTRKVSTKLNAATESAKPTPVAAPTPFQPLTFDQQAIAMAQGFAERAANGDVIHTVKKESESIESISNWYTGSPSNYKEILKSNGLAEGAPLAPGVKLQIPKSLIKQYKAMSAQ